MVVSDAHRKNLNDMLLAIDDCLKAKRQVPALVLMYSLLDIVAWASSDQQSSDIRGNFERWVTKWLLPKLASSEKISATDIYAARCAVLHTGTDVSNLSKTRKAKRIMYAWGIANVDHLAHAIKATNLEHAHVAVHLDTLASAIRAGLEGFLDAAKDDPDLLDKLQAASRAQFTYVPA